MIALRNHIQVSLRAVRLVLEKCNRYLRKNNKFADRIFETGNSVHHRNPHNIEYKRKRGKIQSENAVLEQHQLRPRT